jgi:hypothetical protein
MCRVWFCQFVDIGGLCYRWILSLLNGTLHILYLGRMLRVAVCCVVMLSPSRVGWEAFGVNLIVAPSTVLGHSLQHAVQHTCSGYH